MQFKQPNSMVSSFQSSEPFECIIFLFHNNEDFLPRKRIFPMKYINSVFPPCLLFFPNFCNQYCLWASARETLALTLCGGTPPLSSAAVGHHTAMSSWSLYLPAGSDCSSLDPGIPQPSAPNARKGL